MLQMSWIRLSSNNNNKTQGTTVTHTAIQVLVLACSRGTRRCIFSVVTHPRCHLCRSMQRRPTDLPSAWSQQPHTLPTRFNTTQPTAQPTHGHHPCPDTKPQDSKSLSLGSATYRDEREQQEGDKQTDQQDGQPDRKDHQVPQQDAEDVHRKEVLPVPVHSRLTIHGGIHRTPDIQREIRGPHDGTTAWVGVTETSQHRIENTHPPAPRPPHVGASYTLRHNHAIAVTLFASDAYTGDAAPQQRGTGSYPALKAVAERVVDNRAHGLVHDRQRDLEQRRSRSISCTTCARVLALRHTQKSRESGHNRATETNGKMEAPKAHLNAG